MSEKRFEIKIGEFEEENIVDNLNRRTIREISDMCKKMNKLHEQNKELNQSQASILRELLIYREIANCSNCKYQNYDWFEDGDEFEICEKGNNNQQIEYHICKEWEEL